MIARTAADGCVLYCDECGRPHKLVVELDTQTEFGVRLCGECLRKAVLMCEACGEVGEST